MELFVTPIFPLVIYEDPSIPVDRVLHDHRCFLQAYYDEVTVCGNCMEICRKLDSIRTCGFPEGNPVPVVAPGAKAPLHDPPRPRSEPLPDFNPATNPVKERPGTAAADSDTLCRIENQRGRGGDRSDRRRGRNDVHPVRGGERCPVVRGSGPTMSPTKLENGRLGPTMTEIRTNLGEDVGGGGGEGLGNGDTYVAENDIDVVKKAARVDNKETGYTRREKVRGLAQPK